MENKKLDNKIIEKQSSLDALNKQFVLSKTVSIVDKYNFYEYISVMLDGGVSISEALETIGDKINSVYFKQKIFEMRTYISSGDSFSKSMKKIPQVFTSAEISILEAGESTGTLVEALSKLSDDLKKVHDLRSKVKSAITYPTIIFLFLTLAIIIVLVYVIPAIMPLFETSDVELPGATKALVFTSNFLSTNYLLIILFCFAVYIFFTAYKNTNSGRQSIDHFLLGLPLVGSVYKNYILSNITATLGSLIGSGVSVVKTLTLVGKASNSHIYERLFEDIVLTVSHGEKIVDSMKKVDPEKIYFPADFLQMLYVGERTANLEKISRKINKQYEKEVEYSLANLTKWIEPLAILLAGAFVLWFAFAIFGAIMKITQTVS
ncbi:type II secretion system F family protein [Candidatus Gracilibacteria bacterium 28_42_T64]|nr:type II secretion system F family protein [Candidatus Gracilibacteria bacterium 28_42_T64]